MRTESKAATLPEVTNDSSHALVAHNVSREQTHGPSQAALVRFYQVLAGIVEERHRRCQAAVVIRPDPERGSLLPKAQGTDGDEEGNTTEPGQREGQVAGALVR